MFHRPISKMPKGLFTYCTQRCRSEYNFHKRGDLKIYNRHGKLYRSFRFDSKGELKELMERIKATMRGGYMTIMFD